MNRKAKSRLNKPEFLPYQTTWLSRNAQLQKSRMLALNIADAIAYIRCCSAARKLLYGNRPLELNLKPRQFENPSEPNRD
jgi:hypothetical protein